MTTYHDELVRDKLPEKLEKLGKRVVCHYAKDDDTYRRYLRQKLRDDVLKYMCSEDDTDKLLEVLDVVYELLFFNGNVSIHDVHEWLKEIKEKKGGYDARTILREIIE
jgi:predicted house-cleaning noncanonical NTP pyrophosphatase (MazG superfamily)